MGPETAAARTVRLPDLDSNQDYLIQSQACYRCTIRHSGGGGQASPRDEQSIRARAAPRQTGGGGACNGPRGSSYRFGSDRAGACVGRVLQQQVAEAGGVRDVAQEVEAGRLAGVLDPQAAVAKEAAE